MLSRKEQIILKYIIEKCDGKDTLLFSPDELIHACEPRYDITNLEVKASLDFMMQENYITFVNSDKDGELIYCITLLARGKSFNREQKNKKKSWANAITRTIILAIISFVVGLILKAIFT